MVLKEINSQNRSITVFRIESDGGLISSIMSPTQQKRQSGNVTEDTMFALIHRVMEQRYENVSSGMVSVMQVLTYRGSYSSKQEVYSSSSTASFFLSHL